MKDNDGVPGHGVTWPTVLVAIGGHPHRLALPRTYEQYTRYISELRNLRRCAICEAQSRVDGALCQRCSSAYDEVFLAQHAAAMQQGRSQDLIDGYQICWTLWQDRWSLGMLHYGNAEESPRD